MWQGTKSQCKSKSEKRPNGLQMWRLFDMAAEPRYIAEGSSFDTVRKLKSFKGLLSIFLEKVYSNNTPGVVSKDLPFTPSLY